MTGRIIMGKRGVVGEFIGDAIMAWWNAPSMQKFLAVKEL